MTLTYNQESTNQSIDFQIKQFTLISRENKDDVIKSISSQIDIDTTKRYWGDVRDWFNDSCDNYYNLIFKFTSNKQLTEDLEWTFFSEAVINNIKDKWYVLITFPIDRYLTGDLLDQFIDKLFEACIKDNIHIIFTISNPLSVISLYKAVLKHKLFENDLYTEIEVWNHSKTNNLGYSDYYNDYCKTPDDKIEQFKYNATRYVSTLKEQLKHFLNYTLYGDDRECTDRLYDRFI